MSGKQTFLKTIAALGKPFFNNGFVASQKGQLLKKEIAQSNVVLQLRFQPIELENAKEVHRMGMVCYFVVVSEQVGKWRLQQYRSKDNASATVFFAPITTLLPQTDKPYEWIITAQNKDAVIAEVGALLATYIQPIVELFENKAQLLQHMGKHGWQVNEHINVTEHLFPVDFLMCFAGHAFTEQAFANYLVQHNLMPQAIEAYNQMSLPDFKGFIESTKIEDKTFQLAYLNGLKLPEDTVPSKI